MRDWLAILFAALCVFCSGFAQGATFRNHPDTVHRATICAAILSDIMAKKTENDDSYKRALDVLQSRLFAASAGLSSEKTFDISQKEGARVRFDWRDLKLQTQAVNALVTVEDLGLAIDGVDKDSIYWLTSVKGKAAIEARLAQRREVLRRLEDETRKELRRVLPEVRGANWASAGITGALLAAPAMAMTMAGADGHWGDALYMTLVYAGLYKFWPMLSNAGQQLGLLPVESSRAHSPYDIDFAQHMRKIEERLKSFTPDDALIYADGVVMSSAQFNEMKKCRDENTGPTPQALAATCVFDKQINFFDRTLSNPAFMDLIKEEMVSFITDPRWSAPRTKFIDILVADPVTYEPILVTALMFEANEQLPKGRPPGKKKRLKLTPEQGWNPFSQPALQPIPIGGR